MTAVELATGTEPSWLTIARGEIGVYGGKRVQAYLDTVGALKNENWCSAAMNWVFIQAGIKGTGSPAARSWLHWGVKLDEPRYGCVAVLWRKSRKSWMGHVALFLDQEGENITLLGGNQNGSFCQKAYPLERVLEWRWPHDVP